MPFIAAKSVMFVRNTPARTTSSKLFAGRLQNRREILEDALRRGHNAPLDHLASGRVLGDLSAEEEETIDFDRLGKWADRRREFRRGNCGLAHSNSCGYWVSEHGTYAAKNQHLQEK